jgi:Uncharacterized conserved protein
MLKLFPADEKFAEIFMKEKIRLVEMLGPEVEIEHVGSTAVSGLGGKGIIDMLVGVVDASMMNVVVDILVENGYFVDLDNEITSGRVFLASREHNSTLGDYHLHVVVKNEDEWCQFLFFRDELRRSNELRDRYMNLKKELFVETGADREEYKKMKSDFVQNVLGEKNE